ncbi:alpha/beta fold hydrolase [Chryseobacterium herbae]|uniref:Alpha/beta fold hydrolase n=1 Tax=Chryseobacterium herbae TaxID=2976476 RepID=A0ABT2IQW0_9FLAO|nr:alpha/beta fold hydrolase [Chryseobacterium sp. pc1-10]MCT2561211.1 alpha/beta fold hydrolase [Chryseobacterium sp. pc1-10]
MKITLFAAYLSILILAVSSGKAQKPGKNKQQYARLGDFNLESGQKIEDCKIGFRTYGKLNADRSNAVIFPTWFTGTTKELESMVPGKIVDTLAYHLILFDALGNGVSSSPSNSSKQARLQFPVFTIRDMVESQHQVLTGNMGIHHLEAVCGISMGGMQTFQWAVTYPELMNKIVSIVGSPQLTTSDLLLWNAELNAMERDPAYLNGNYEQKPLLPGVTMMHQFALTTPEYLSNAVSRDDFSKWLAKKESENMDWNDMHRQLEALKSHNIAKFGGTLEQAAKEIKAKMLIIVSRQDHMVNPLPATRFAEMTNARLFVLEGNCGHIAPWCEAAEVRKTVQSFLKK